MRAIAVLFLALLPSCATIIDGGPDFIPLQTAPTGATIKLDGTAIGTTPASVPVKRTAKGLIRVELAGFHPRECQLESGMNGWMFVNCLFGLAGIPGILIDAVSGNSQRWATRALEIPMTPLTEPAPPLLWTRPKPATQPSNPDDQITG